MSATLFRTASVGSGGAYRIDRLVPGEYLVVAVPDADRGKWQDATFLAGIADRAMRIRITPGLTVTQDLRLTGGR